jgi:hypothetical protein
MGYRISDTRRRSASAELWRAGRANTDYLEFLFVANRASNVGDEQARKSPKTRG